MAKFELRTEQRQGAFIRTRAFLPDLAGNAMLYGTATATSGIGVDPGGSYDASTDVKVQMYLFELGSQKTYDLIGTSTDLGGLGESGYSEASPTSGNDHLEANGGDGTNLNGILLNAAASWGLDDVGYVFDHIIGPDTFGESAFNTAKSADILGLMKPGRKYRIEYVVTPATTFLLSGPVTVVHEVSILPRLSVAP